MENIFEEIKQERARQDEQWGGAEHDDGHDLHDWSTYILHQLGHRTRAHSTPKELLAHVGKAEARERLIKIAALAVAAIESIDRKS